MGLIIKVFNHVLKKEKTSKDTRVVLMISNGFGSDIKNAPAFFTHSLWL